MNKIIIATLLAAALPLCAAAAWALEGKTTAGFPGLKNVSVDAKSRTLKFSVNPGAKVDMAKMQASLKAASDEMGMGADYSLSDIRKQAPVER